MTGGHIAGVLLWVGTVVAVDRIENREETKEVRDDARRHK